MLKTIKASELLAKLDVKKILPVFRKFFSRNSRYEKPLIKFFIWLKGRNPYQGWKELKANPKLARELGFARIPSFSYIWYIINKKLKESGLEEIHSAIIKACDVELEKRGEKFGESSSADAYPVEAWKNDLEAEYNGYYKKKVYLVHKLMCKKSGLCLAKITTNGNEDEGKKLPFLMEKVSKIKIKVNELFADNGYSSYENYALLGNGGIKTYIKFRENSKYHWKGFLKILRKRYKKAKKKLLLWEEIKKPKDFWERVLYALNLAGDIEWVGEYYRNRSLREFRKNPRAWNKKYYEGRNKIENSNGQEKEQLKIRLGPREKGLRKVKIKVELAYISQAGFALAKLQQGINSNLTSLAEIA